MQMQDVDVDQEEGQHEDDVLGDCENAEGEDEEMMELLQVPEEPEPWEKEDPKELKPEDNKDVEMEQKPEDVEMEDNSAERKARDGPKEIVWTKTTSKFVFML